MKRRLFTHIRPSTGGGFDLTGLLAYLKFNNNITDSSTFARSTTQTGITYANGLYTGAANEAAWFTNGNDVVTIPDAADLSFGNGATDSDFTISVIIRPLAVSLVQTIAAKGDYFSGNQMEYFLFLNTDNKMYFYITDISTGGSKIFVTSTTFAANTTYTIDAVYEGGTLKIYSNGSLLAGTPSTSGTYVAMENGTKPVWIGYNTDQSTWGFGGYMDEFTIWSRALSSTEVSDKYTLFLAGTPLL